MQGYRFREVATGALSDHVWCGTPDQLAANTPAGWEPVPVEDAGHPERVPFKSWTFPLDKTRAAALEMIELEAAAAHGRTMGATPELQRAYDEAEAEAAAFLSASGGAPAPARLAALAKRPAVGTARAAAALVVEKAATARETRRQIEADRIAAKDAIAAATSGKDAADIADAFWRKWKNAGA